jgi:hypothetical protein
VRTAGGLLPRRTHGGGPPSVRALDGPPAGV